MRRRLGVVVLSVAIVFGLAAFGPDRAVSAPEAEPTQYIVIPKLIGLTLVEARAKLTALGHRGSLVEIKNTKCADKPRVEHGQVCYQKPAHGTQLGTRSPLQVLVKGAWKQKKK